MISPRFPWILASLFFASIAAGADTAPFKFRLVDVSPSIDGTHAPRDPAAEPIQLGATLWVEVISTPVATTAKPLQLYVNGLLVAQTPQPASSSQLVVKAVHAFHLTANSKADATSWMPLLRRPVPGGAIPVQLQLALAENALRSEPLNAQLETWPLYRAIGWAIVTLFMLAAIWYWWRSDLLRDPPAMPTPKGARSTAPFSLGRVQMAFWTVLVVSAYVFIWTTTGRLDTLNDSVLALIGIAAGTGLSAVMIGQNKKGDARQKFDDANTTLAKATADVTSYTATLATLPAGDPQAVAIRAQLATAQSDVTRLTKQVADLTRTLSSAATSDGMITDIMSDSVGISFHRFQLVLWTIVLGLIFAITTYRNLVMLDFDMTLLGLMGISSGTYLGFKFPEQ